MLAVWFSGVNHHAGKPGSSRMQSSFGTLRDIRCFFDSVSHEWLVRFVEHRIGDQRIVRLIRKWLKAGVLEDGVLTVSEQGTGQGSVTFPPDSSAPNSKIA